MSHFTGPNEPSIRVQGCPKCGVAPYPGDTCPDHGPFDPFRDSRKPNPEAENIAALQERIAELTPLSEEAEQRVSDLGFEYRGMWDGRVPNHSAAKLDLFDRMSDAASEAYNLLSEIEMCRVALAELGAVEDDSAALVWCAICGQDTDPKRPNAATRDGEPICSACDPISPIAADDLDPDPWNNRNAPPREFPAMGEDDWAAEAVWNAGLGT